MGGIWIARNELITSISEIVGYKSGLALSKRRLLRHVSVDDRHHFQGPEANVVRIRSEEYEQLIANVLFGVGNIKIASCAPFAGRQYHRYKTDSVALNVYSNIVILFHHHLAAALRRSGHVGENQIAEPILFRNGEELVREWTILSLMVHEHGADGIDTQSILRHSEQAFGDLGVEIATDLIDDFYEQRHRNPWGTYRRVEWNDVAELEDLFRSESLITQYGQFFDQRYIDYLDHNFGEIDRIHWRKFEGLTGEFFNRAGFQVAVGPGRNDNGIDIRASRTRNDAPEMTILIQCKRQKEKIGKVVVKALWADVVEENARSGLIVTTSALAPGAERVRVARGYHVATADRMALKKWLKRMRTPRAGIFMGE